MTDHHHPIITEFPELREKIHELKISNAHFLNLLEKYEETDKVISRSEARVELMSEEEEEQHRKERLKIKDEIYKILSA